mmetsp:Transcript_28928/g.46833  ORF Transcript_28928/g.46833 Transcript_28928/m.46833 type:complete len:220 (-) Transcript_28928:550-1209(-)|eukprot:CAMPEP_0184658852 /NCGR_PEP_ID=MMETSP0308-20130426/27164_1 /TAXON_ID=38269 /ORGANISM="Gloeochaete witrockiana, Strain SAG 46.84" /LENGTH=219 /DNA_ID=CAMNT_0027098177 /DNA_START=110 /DNA_END=769 /DNA_ORIENTATION=+
MLRFFVLVLLASVSFATVLHQYEAQQVYTWSGNRNPWVVKFSRNLNSNFLGQTTKVALGQYQPGISTWYPKALYDSQPAQRLSLPHLFYNNASVPWPTPAQGDGSRILPRNVVLHPGQNGEFTHLVFVAPARATYIIQADFYASAKTVSADAHLLVKGVEFWAAEISSDSGSNYYVPHRFSLSVALNQNEEIAFVVGYGSNYDFSSDWAGLSAKIQAAF